MQGTHVLRRHLNILLLRLNGSVQWLIQISYKENFDKKNNLILEIKKKKKSFLFDVIYVKIMALRI